MNRDLLCLLLYYRLYQELTSVVNFRVPTYKAVRFIADNMRDSDVAEVWASGRYTPLSALDISVSGSDKVVVVYHDDTPLAVLGLVVRDLLAGVGTPWLLSAKHALGHKRQFLKLAPSIIEEMLDICPKLVNHVYIENKLTIRWLRWLGFTIDDAVPIQGTGELFHKFHMER